MKDDTFIGGPIDRFPATRHSAVEQLASDDHAVRQRALATLIETYWKPVYKYIRVKWNRDSDAAADLTQSFFLRVIEKNFLASFDARRARFRTYLRTCLDRFVMNEDEAASRVKRGGEATIVSADFGAAEAELARVHAGTGPADDVFEREWIRSLLSLAVDDLKSHCESTNRSTQFALFERYDLTLVGAGASGGELSDGATRPTYAQLAAEHGITTETVTNYLAYARHEFRRFVLQRIRNMTASESEFRQEVRIVLGVDLQKESP